MRDTATMNSKHPIMDSNGDPARELTALPKPSIFPRISSIDVMRGHTKLIIEHQGEEYYLRLTGKGKLILTK